MVNIPNVAAHKPYGLDREVKEVVEIRRNPDGSIDEVVAHGVNLHIEQMDNAGWYLGLNMPDGSYWQFWIGAKNGRSHVELRHTETTPGKDD